MSTSYRPVSWNPTKRRYDTVALVGLASYLAMFTATHAWLRPELTVETILIRAFGSAALLLLHVVLAIGPLARHDRRFLPLLYNRRHLGVMTFATALAHGTFALVQFHTLGTIDPLANLLAGDAAPGLLPFQPLGLAALAILFVMAATSHDFWLRHLTAPVWKTLHLGVYFAYALVVLHVAFGVLQQETDASLAWVVGAGVLLVVGLHASAARREARVDAAQHPAADPGDGFVDVCGITDLRERRGVVTCLGGERVAIFKYDGKVSALSNVCQHQNGPLGEGRIVEDCIVCPWHGYEYLPDSGASPAPFTERVPTFNLRLDGDRVLVHPVPNPPGTRVPPARLAGHQS